MVLDQRTKPTTAGAWIEVDTAAIRRNVEAVCRFAGPGVRVMAIVKADGYGHGAVQTALAALAGGASHLGVATPDEGIELRAAGITAPVLVLGCGLPEQAPLIVEHGLTQTLATEEMARAVSQAAAATGRTASVHIKVDTGMGRLGVRPHEALAFAQLVTRLPGMSVAGIYSHLASADADDPGSASEQARVFETVLAELAANRVAFALRHLANSAATVRFPGMHYDLVRVGLLTYGLDALSPEVTRGLGHTLPRLSPALAVKARIVCIKDMPAGQPLSYGGTYTTSRPTRIAYLPVGYADGYARALSNAGFALVQGRRCPVVGAVCMDQMLVDIGDTGAGVGDEAVLIGEQAGARITANDLAAAQGTVTHEIVARLGKRLPRVYLPAGGERR